MSDALESHPADLCGCYRVPNGIICLVPATVKFLINGVIHYVEPAHGYSPPLRLRKDGEVHARQWGPRSPFWDDYSAWERGGRLLTGNGIAIYPGGM